MCFFSKRVLLCIYFYLLFHQFVLAQITLLEQVNKPVIGDRIDRHIVTGLYSGDRGDNVLWDFSDAIISDDIFPIRFSFDSIGFKSVEFGIRNYYLQRDDTMLIHAYQSSLEYMYYTQPPIFITYPFCYGDSIASSFSGKGNYCNTYNLSHTGMRIVMADAKGNILLPDQRVLTDVLRVHTFTLNNILLEGLESNLIDSAKAKQELIENYSWYVRGCRYPVFEYSIKTSYNKETQVASTYSSYCYLPDSVIDKSMSFEEALHKGISDIKSSTYANNHGEKMLPIDYHMLQSDNTIQLSYSTTTNAMVTFIIASNMGMIYQNKSFHCEGGETYETTFNCNGYRPGGYILYINVNGIVSSEKFQVK